MVVPYMELSGFRYRWPETPPCHLSRMPKFGKRLTFIFKYAQYSGVKTPNWGGFSALASGCIYSVTEFANWYQRIY
jgi:hypothetical protein